MEKQINSTKQMQKLGYKISKKHSKILIYGELGAGKTQFAKGFGKGLDIDSKTVKSPTYKYMHNYNNKLLHIDMYRINSQDLLVQKGILNAINNFEKILIERPKYTQLYVGKDRTTIKIIKDSPENRTVKIQKNNN